MDHVDIIVVGAGVVGLSVARRLALGGDSVIVIEEAGHFGTGISSRNSEVIHAGIYYKAGSLKAQACVDGKERLYDYLADRQLPHRKCGKLIVATTESQAIELQNIKLRAQNNGVTDLEWRTARDVGVIEPAISCVMALWSPSTGILDSHSYMQSLIADIEGAGGMLVFNAAFVSARSENGFTVSVRDTGSSDSPYQLHCDRLINCAGLGAQSVARQIEGLDSAHVPDLFLAKGTYFGLAGPSPFSHLIYPVPEPGGLGVHVTMDMGGQVKFGPDVQWIDMPDFSPDPQRASYFYSAIRSYYPSLADNALIPAYCGIRPKLKPRDRGDSDFLISGSKEHGVAGLVNLFGIESPGLTASLAIAELVEEQCH